MVPRKVQYFPGVFEVRDLESAKAIILTNEGPGADTATRWALETSYVTALIAEHLHLKNGDLLLESCKRRVPHFSPPLREVGFKTDH